MLKRSGIILAGAVALLVLSGCGLFGGQTTQEPPTLTPTSPLPTLPPVTLAPTLPQVTLAPPTLTPSPTDNLAPTALPAPTEIVPLTPTPQGAEGQAASGTPAPASALGGPGISINPQLGEPGETIVVTGSGFPPNSTITLHWGPVNGPIGPVYWEVQSDATGAFTVGLIVLPADRWPGGAPREGDFLQLRATSPNMGGAYYWANFRYVKRFNPVTSLVQTYTNEEYGYAIDLPNGWRWSWDENEGTDDVRFTAPSGVGKGFILVLSASSAGAVIPSVMSAEFPGQTYTTAEATLGAYPGTSATTANGRTVWFIPRGGRVYVLSFTDDNGQFYLIIASSFRLN